MVTCTWKCRLFGGRGGACGGSTAAAATRVHGRRNEGRAPHIVMLQRRRQQYPQWQRRWQLPPQTGSRVTCQQHISSSR